MLQWMGGSRRKVASTRKSTQKRQKQYFEQRRRQQQEHSGVESYEGGVNVLEQNRREQRSLDVLSLANLSAVSQQPKHACSSPIEARENLVFGTSNADYLITEEPPVANAVNIADHVEIDKQRAPSVYQVETTSPNEVLVNSPSNHSKAFGGTTNKPDLVKTVTQQEFSLFDLLGDDESNRDLEERSVPEDHVAFSVEGLGKIGPETPPHSPQQPDRYDSYCCSTPLRVRRQLSSSNNFSYVLNDVGIESDATMQDHEIPLSSSLEFSTVSKDLYGKLKQNLHDVGDHLLFDGHSDKIRSPFSHMKTSYDTRNDTEDLLDDSSSFFDANFMGGRKYYMPRKSWQHRRNNDSADFLRYGIDEMPEYTFEASKQLKKRDAFETRKEFNILDPPASSHQVSKDYYDFKVSDGSRHRTVGTEFSFDHMNMEPEWPNFFKEDARDNLSLLSQESSSSAAVRGDATTASLPNSEANNYKRYQNAFDSPKIKCGYRDNSSQGKHCKSTDDHWQGNSEFISGKSIWMPNLSEPKADQNLDFFQERTGPLESQFYGGSCRSAYMTSGLSSVFQFPEAKHPSSTSKAWNDDVFSAGDSKPQADSEFSFSRFKHDDPVKDSPSGCFISDNLLFQTSSHSSSKVEFRSTTPDITVHSPNFEGRPPDLPNDAPGKNPMPDLTAQKEENQSKCEKIETRIKNKNAVAMDSSDSPESKAEVAAEEVSPDNIPDKSESSLYEVKCHQNAELTGQNGNQEIDLQKHGGRKTATKRPSATFLNSSPKVLMMQSYVLQLLCVQR